MDHFAGLDVSVKATSVCIVDDTGRTPSGRHSARLPQPSISDTFRYSNALGRVATLVKSHRRASVFAQHWELIKTYQYAASV